MASISINDALAEARVTLKSTVEGKHDCPCPECGPNRQHKINQLRKVLRVWIEKTSVSMFCVRCGWKFHRWTDDERNYARPSHGGMVRNSQENSGGNNREIRGDDRWTPGVRVPSERQVVVSKNPNGSREREVQKGPSGSRDVLVSRAGDSGRSRFVVPSRDLRR